MLIFRLQLGAVPVPNIFSVFRIMIKDAYTFGSSHVFLQATHFVLINYSSVAIHPRKGPFAVQLVPIVAHFSLEIIVESLAHLWYGLIMEV